jgi:hypothetical protein
LDIVTQMLNVDELPSHTRIAMVAGKPIFGRMWNQLSNGVTYDENGVPLPVPAYFNDRLLDNKFRRVHGSN